MKEISVKIECKYIIDLNIRLAKLFAIRKY